MEGKSNSLPPSIDWEDRIGKMKFNACINHDGIHFLYNKYASSELSQLRRELHSAGKKCSVKFVYDPDDLGRIRVLNPLTLKYIDVLSSDPDMAGVSELKHRKIINSMIKEDRANRAYARVEIGKTASNPVMLHAESQITLSEKPSSRSRELETENI